MKALGKAIAIGSIAILVMNILMSLTVVSTVTSITSAFTANAENSGVYSASSSDRCDEKDDSTTAVGGDTGELPDVVGMSTTQAMDWFGGQQGPNNVCAPYALGQCTWWSCMREHKMGNTTGSYWGNGNQWVSSAVANGWREGVVEVGSVVSFVAGSTTPAVGGGSQTVAQTYGHVAVIEVVNEDAKTFTTSEKGGSVNVYSYTYSYDPLPDTLSVAAPPEGGGGETATSGDSGDSGEEDIDDCKVDGEDTSGDAVSEEDGWHADPETAKKIARDLIRTGYPDWDNDEDWEALVWIYDHESGWRWNADNPTSDAYGIPQSLPGSKMATFGDDWQDNATTQLKWGLSYIKGRYNSPHEAKEFWEANHWY